MPTGSILAVLSIYYTFFGIGRVLPIA